MPATFTRGEVGWWDDRQSALVSLRMMHHHIGSMQLSIARFARSIATKSSPSADCHCKNNMFGRGRGRSVWSRSRLHRIACTPDPHSERPEPPEKRHRSLTMMLLLPVAISVITYPSVVYLRPGCGVASLLHNPCSVRASIRLGELPNSQIRVGQ